MTEIVRVSYGSGAMNAMLMRTIDGDTAPYAVIHDGLCVARVRSEPDARLLKYAWEMREMLAVLSGLSADSRLGVERKARIDELLGNISA